MVYIIEKQPTIPIGTLIEPLVKQLHAAHSHTYLPNTFDFEFFTSLARHGKLELKHGVLLLDLLAKAYISEPEWASCCQVPFLLITSRFVDRLPIRQFLRQFHKIAFAELPKLEKDAKQEPPEQAQESDIYNEMTGLPRYDKNVPNHALKTLPPFPKAPEDHRIQDASRKIKRAYIIQIALKILELRHYGISEDLKLEALEANRVNIKLYKKNHKGLMKILENFGNPKHIIEEYMHDIKIEKREQETRQKAERQKEQEEAVSRRKRTIKSRRYDSSSSSSSKSSLNNRMRNDESSSELSFENGKIVQPPAIPKKSMTESKSDFSLMNKISKAKKNLPSHRKIETRQSKSGHKKRQNGSMPRQEFPTNPKPVKAFEAFDQQIPSSSSSERGLESSSSSERGSLFPPISSKHSHQKLYSDTKSKLSSLSHMKSSRLGKKRRASDKYVNSDGTMSIGALKRRRKIHVKSLAKLPKNKVERRAFKDLEKLRKKKRKKEKIKEYERQQRLMKEEREKYVLKNELERRKLVLGVHSTNEYMDDFKQIIFDLGDPEVARYEKWQNKIKKDIELFNFDEEEYRDKQGIILFAKKYSKLLKFLFNKYANSGYSNADVSNFDKMGKKAATISIAELQKLLKEHGVSEKELTKKEVKKLVSLVSTKLMRKSSLHSLNYAGFEQFLLQVAHLLYTREPHDLSHLPPVEHLRNLISKFRYAAKSRGESTLLYEDPDITFITDKDVLRELNFMILENPSYPLPDGYYKVQEKEMRLYYELPEYYEITESQKVCTELLDSFFDQIFGFHFLEPIARFEKITKVKPSFKKLSKPLPSTVRNKKNPKIEEINPLDMQNKTARKRSKSRKRELKPKLSTNMKLLVAQAPFEERAYVNEVAEVLEEILQASENGFSRLPPRNETRVGNIINRVKLEEEKRKMEERRIKEERDIKIRKHHSQLRKEMEKRRQEKLRRDEEANKLLAQKRKIELEKQRKKEEERKRYLQTQKAKIQMQKQKELEELKLQTEQTEKKKKAQKEKNLKENKEFLQKQKAKFRSDFNAKIKERKDLANLESELEYQKEVKKKQIMDNMVRFLEDHKYDKENDLKQREEINYFHEQASDVFEEYASDVKKVFRHYSKANVKTIDNKLLNNVTTIDKEEFVKFGKGTKIVPNLLNYEILLHIFKILSKQRIEAAGPDDELGLVLDEYYFEKALIMIAIEARDILGGSLKPKEKDDEEYKSRYQIGTRNKSRDKSHDNSSSRSPDGKKPKPKTLAGKRIAELEKKKPKYETEIKDIKITHKFDVSSITVDTLESLILKYF